MIGSMVGFLKRLRSFPPKYKNKSNQMTEAGMLSCVLAMLGPDKFKEFDLQKEHKNEMRDLILSKGPFNEYEQKAIQAYCLQDIKPLPLIYTKMLQYYHYEFGVDIRETMLERGQYVASLGIVEQNGMPINVDLLKKIVGKHGEIDKAICESMNNHFELFEFLPRFNKYKFTNSKFTEFIRSLRLHTKWPKTSTGSFCTDEKTINKFRHIKAIETFYQCKKSRATLRYINPKTKGNIFDYIGDDNRIRPYFGQFGTSTGRQAPKAKSFVLAQSNWMRILLKPEAGKKIVAIDYSSEEFAIGASISGDKNMIEAYESGDVYLHFAKLAGAVPKDGLKKDYKKERELFKATVLGLSYGMGKEKLAKKLTDDTGEKVSVSKAEGLVRKHRKSFSDYYNYFNKVLITYKKNGCIATEDNFVMFGDNPNDLSTKNFLVQGAGASILRDLTTRLIRNGVEMIAGLHDAAYFIIDENDTTSIGLVKELMSQAALRFCSVPIRMDVEEHSHDEDWVEFKGRRDWERISAFLKED